MRIQFLRAGLLDTIQDQGRPGFLQYGVPEGGAADRTAMTIANRLVGNDDGAACLEITLHGPALAFPDGGVIAMTGGLFEVLRSGGKYVRNATVSLSRGETLEIGRAVQGCRGYLAFPGGIEVEAVLGSRSTFTPAGFGGLDGRSLRPGDELSAAIGSPQPRLGEADWDYSVSKEIRVVAGPQLNQFTESALVSLYSSQYEVSARSDRSGIRLKGLTLPSDTHENFPSQGVLPGAIQVPPDGQPIITGRDGPVTGGYPVIAGVISADLDRLAQLRPGDRLRFVSVGQAEAAKIWKDHVKRLDCCISWLD